MLFSYHVSVRRIVPSYHVQCSNSNSNDWFRLVEPVHFGNAWNYTFIFIVQNAFIIGPKSTNNIKVFSYLGAFILLLL